MQTTANTTHINLASILRSLLQIRPRLRAAAPESYTLYAPGYGMIGDYATANEAENARCRLPYSVRQQAEIYDENGACLCR